MAEDSTNLSDTEVASAAPSEGATDIVSKVKASKCATCGEPFQVLGYRLRRRGPHLYWCMSVCCGRKHSNVLVFLADWLMSTPTIPIG